ncbi:MAG: UDP-N-acetylglucosamine--N-acetylmuramyl-(pentapeptide) pyrophosphoryl-undecaprenol N-acetylglucosamine transferase [Pseudomonadaceae bacterium]|nr:UDP-N-acetylglucosamine--N-acetylmuramyl-(pentapeptide) pyrophosphoryl-undecaprenol N-acetylglucosamine transferase [Pseudomonadaceae bacterium]
MARKKTIFVAAGASGGHVFPALATAEELKKKGYACVFVMGGGKFGHVVEAAGFKVERLPAAAFANRGVVRLAAAGIKLAAGLLKALWLVGKYKPVAAFGTGGYATVATMMACKMRGVPTVIHNADAILGRANRLLARWVKVVLLTFEGTPVPETNARVRVVGTPLRKEVLAARKRKREEDGTFRLLVLGGSQGARIMSDVVPEAVAMLTARQRARVVVVQQARAEDVARVQNAYAQLGLAGYEVRAFFEDLPRKYVDAHVVIGRSGVGTLLEAATLGRAAIYCPHRLADNHQLFNAQVAERAGAAVVMEQPYFTPANLLVQVKALMADRTRVEAMEAAAKKLARPNAARDAADVVVEVAG